MGTVSEKLVYLNGTKQAIKQAINEDFEVIDNNTTFREYAEEISSNNAKYKDLIPKVNVNGTNNIDISNSSGLDKALVTQYGNTYQETTTGNQLLDFSKYDSKSSPTMTLTFENDVLTTTCIASEPYMNFTWIITDLIKANPGKTLSFTFDKYDVSQATDSSVNLQIYTGSNVSYFALVRPDGTSVPYTIPEDVSNISTVNFRILPNNLATPKASTLVITKPMLQFGTDKLDYEEYSGGKPSPNPDYPQEIQVVTGDNSIKVEGKNLFNLKDTYYKRLDTGSVTINDNDIKVENVHTAAHQFIWWNIPIIVGDEITISYNSLTESTTNNNNGVFYTFNDEPYTSFVSFENFSKVDKTNKYSTTTATKKYLVIGLRNVPSCTNTLNKLQIEKGNTPTTYEPYQSVSYPISLGDIELCKIGDYKDRIYPLNGKWYLEKKIDKIVLNGNENINLDTTKTITQVFNISNVLSRGVKDNLGICNYFINQAGDTEKFSYLISNIAYRTLYIAINKTKASTVQEFKTWLSTHNTSVYYPLATPITTEITENNYPTLYNQLNNIKLFEGVNHITMTNESGLDVEFDITYYKDWKLD